MPTVLPGVRRRGRRGRHSRQRRAGRSGVRDALLMAVVYLSLPVILLQPYLGLLVYSWLGYMRPQALAFGASREMPLSAWVAIAMLIGIALAMGREKIVTWRGQTFLLVLLGLCISVTTCHAVSPDEAAAL